MLVSRTPSTIALAGAGTDRSSFYCEHGGCVIGAAVDKHLYVAVNSALEADDEMPGTRNESDIILDTVLERYAVPRSTSLAYLSDFHNAARPARAGQYLLGLVAAARAERSLPIDPNAIAADAASIANELFGTEASLSHIYCASYGGLSQIEISPGGEISIARLFLPRSIEFELAAKLIIYRSRDGRSLAANVMPPSKAACTTAFSVGMAIRSCDLLRMGLLMHELWQTEVAASVDDDLGRLYHELRKDFGVVGGAVSGELSDLLLLYSEGPRASVELRMKEAGFTRVPWELDSYGAVLQNFGTASVFSPQFSYEAS